MSETYRQIWADHAAWSFATACCLAAADELERRGVQS